MAGAGERARSAQAGRGEEASSRAARGPCLRTTSPDGRRPGRLHSDGAAADRPADLGGRGEGPTRLLLPSPTQVVPLKPGVRPSESTRGSRRGHRGARGLDGDVRELGRARRPRALAPTLLGLALLLGPATAGAAPPPEGPAEGPSPAPRAVVGEPVDALDDPDADADDERPPAAPTIDGKPRRFMIGLEGVALLTPALRPQLIRVDRRYVGETTTLGGAGIFGRWRAVDRIALDLGVRAGSLRFQDAEKGNLVAQDLVLAELGALLFLARGEIGHLAIDAGVGGLAHQIRYSTAGGLEGTQRVGAALFRTGLDIELLLKRLAFVISLRAYGVITDRDRTSSEGTIFEGVDPALRTAPVPVYQTYVIGSAGVAYRF